MLRFCATRSPWRRHMFKEHPMFTRITSPLYRRTGSALAVLALVFGMTVALPNPATATPDTAPTVDATVEAAATEAAATGAEPAAPTATATAAKPATAPPTTTPAATAPADSPGERR